MESVAKAERYVVGIEVVDDDDNDDDAHEDNSCDRINNPPFARITSSGWP